MKLGEGDIVPALDIEHDPLPKPGSDVAASWSARCEELVSRIAEQFGDALVYITKREWVQLGSPAWVLERPLWVAHYTPAPKPATPGDIEPTIWQYRVGPFDPQGPGGFDKARPELDHNKGLKDLPLIGKPADAGMDDMRDHVALTLPETIIIA